MISAYEERDLPRPCPPRPQTCPAAARPVTAMALGLVALTVVLALKT